MNTTTAVDAPTALHPIRALPPLGGKPILCVDFDGVLHSYESGWQGAAVVGDGPVPGAIAWLHEVVNFFDVQVYSSRSKELGGVAAMRAAIGRWERDWREEEGASGRPTPRTALNVCLSFPTQKPPAFLTIDDRAVCFVGIFPPAAALLGFKPWNKPS